MLNVQLASITLYNMKIKVDDLDARLQLAQTSIQKQFSLQMHVAPYFFYFHRPESPDHMENDYGQLPSTSCSYLNQNI